MKLVHTSKPTTYESAVKERIQKIALRRRETLVVDDNNENIMIGISRDVRHNERINTVYTVLESCTMCNQEATMHRTMRFPLSDGRTDKVKAGFCQSHF